MPKLLSRIVAVLLVPCLLSELAISAVFSHSLFHIRNTAEGRGSSDYAFREQAIASAPPFSPLKGISKKDPARPIVRKEAKRRKDGGNDRAEEETELSASRPAMQLVEGSENRFAFFGNGLFLVSFGIFGSVLLSGTLSYWSVSVGAVTAFAVSLLLRRYRKLRWIAGLYISLMMAIGPMIAFPRDIYHASPKLYSVNAFEDSMIPADPSAVMGAAYYPPVVQRALPLIRKENPTFYRKLIDDPVYTVIKPLINGGKFHKYVIGDPVIFIDTDWVNDREIYAILKHERTHYEQYKQSNHLRGIIRVIFFDNAFIWNLLDKEKEAFHNSGHEMRPYDEEVYRETQSFNRFFQWMLDILMLFCGSVGLYATWLWSLPDPIIRDAGALRKAG